MKIREKNTENRILKAALRQFGDKGYFKATVDDIAQSAGVAKGTLYLYFKNKEAIYIGTCVRQFDQVMSEMLAEIDSMTTAEQKLIAIARYLSSYISKIKTLYPLFNLDNIHLSARTLKGLRSVVMPKMIKMNEMVTDVISAGIKDNEFRHFDPKIASFCFINIIRSLFMAGVFKIDTVDHVNEMMKIFFDGIKRR